MATEPRHTAGEHHPRNQQAAGTLEADKKRLAEEREKRAKEHAEREKKRGTPTPTQEEIDLIKLGHHIDLADDGSGPDPNEKLNTVKHIGAKPSAEYATRQVSAKGE